VFSDVFLLVIAVSSSLFLLALMLLIGLCQWRSTYVKSLSKSSQNFPFADPAVLELSTEKLASYKKSKVVVVVVVIVVVVVVVVIAAAAAVVC